MSDRIPLVALLAGAALLAACGGPAELQWTEGAGYRWAPLSPGAFGGTGFAQRGASRTGIAAALRPDTPLAASASVRRASVRRYRSAHAAFW